MGELETKTGHFHIFESVEGGRQSSDCKQFSAYSTTKTKKAVSSLEQDIKHLENMSQNDAITRHLFQHKHQILGPFLQEKVKGAMDMDAPSSFLNLEKTVGQRRHMACHRLPDSRVTTDSGEMRSFVLPSLAGRIVIWRVLQSCMRGCPGWFTVRGRH